MFQQIILRNIEKPREKNERTDMGWICSSLGVSSGRDIHHISTQILSDLLRRSVVEPHISSENLADDLVISSSRVNHHVRNLMDSGIVYRQKRCIYVRGGSLLRAVESLRKDANVVFDELETMAKEIDNSLGIKNR